MFMYLILCHCVVHIERLTENRTRWIPTGSLQTPRSGTRVVALGQTGLQGCIESLLLKYQEGSRSIEHNGHALIQYWQYAKEPLAEACLFEWCSASLLELVLKKASEQNVLDSSYHAGKCRLLETRRVPRSWNDKNNYLSTVCICTVYKYYIHLHHIIYTRIHDISINHKVGQRQNTLILHPQNLAITLGISLYCVTSGQIATILQPLVAAMMCLDERRHNPQPEALACACR